MKTLYELLTNPSAANWLKNTVVIIDPCLNPDGRDRYVNWFNSVVGAAMNPQPMAREHAEPWPGGRSNHYNFDLNRDWAWQTQVESQQRIARYNQWMPHVHVDFHEQGFNEPYYFAPAAEPYHEVITPWQRSFQNIVGRNHARYFDQNGWLYFTKERFDLLYPSYGDTWPTYNGSIGMTYEQGGHSRGGLGVINEDGDTLTLKDRVAHHHTTGMSTVELASLHAGDLQKNFQQFFTGTVNNGAGEYKTYVVKAKGNEGKLDKLLDLLRKNGIEYGNANAGNLRGFSYPSGKEESFKLEPDDVVITTYQPRGQMVKVLFEPNAKLSDSATYDITAWSLPYAFGLKAFGVREKLAVSKTKPAAGAREQAMPMKYGYLVRWQGMGQARFLAACLREGIKARVAERKFSYKGLDYPAGTLIFLKTSNSAILNLESRLQKLAMDHGVALNAVETGFMDGGIDFGSPDVKTMHPLRIAIATGESTSSLAAGELWHFFDHDLHYPVTMVNVSDIANLPLSRYDVLILPDGYNYRSLFEKDGILKPWVQQGGKLIALENAAAQVAGADWGLSLKKADEAKTGEYELLKPYGGQQAEGMKSYNPGGIFRVEMDTSHPLAFGFDKQYFTLKLDDVVYEFMKNGWNVGVIKKESQVAGFTGSIVKAKLKDGVLFGEIPMGRGSVVFLADDVVFRNFWENGKMLLVNAIFMVNLGSGFHL
jgi:hypothetical protein